MQRSEPSERSLVPGDGVGEKSGRVKLGVHGGVCEALPF